MHGAHHNIHLLPVSYPGLYSPVWIWWSRVTLKGNNLAPEPSVSAPSLEILIDGQDCEIIEFYTTVDELVCVAPAQRLGDRDAVESSTIVLRLNGEDIATYCCITYSTSAAPKVDRFPRAISAAEDQASVGGSGIFQGD